MPDPVALTLRAFVDSVDVRVSTISALNRAINEAFADAGISIAFPQRDLHLDTTRPLQIELRGSAHAPEAGGLKVDPTEWHQEPRDDAILTSGYKCPRRNAAPCAARLRQHSRV